MVKRDHVVAGIVVLLLALAAAAFVSWRASKSNLGGSPDGPQAPPHCGGEQVTLISALASAPYDLSLPDGTAANKDFLEATWDCPGTTTLLEFTTGLTLNLDVNAIADPPWAWKHLTENHPKVFSVGEINGVTASFIQPSSDPDGFAEGGVIFVVDGIYVSVGGDGKIPLDDLVAAAKELVVTGK
jgi:hypothetical protein